jgi:hypothetical protein
MTPSPIIQGFALTASLVTLYTVPTNDSSISSVKVTGMRFINTDPNQWIRLGIPVWRYI